MTITHEITEVANIKSCLEGMTLVQKFSVTDLFKIWLNTPKEGCCDNTNNLCSHYVDTDRKTFVRKPYEELCERERRWIEYCHARDNKFTEKGA